MYNHQLSTFLKVSRTGSFTAASEEMFISTSAVIQQMNALERDLKTKLFIRKRSGVLLTPAGEYLVHAASDYIAKGDEIRRRVSEISMSGTTICIGTSIMEKIRLLYDLWILFSERNSCYNIRIVNIDTEQNQLQNAELIEAVQDGAPWQKGWEFMEICQVPFGCAVAADHPLSHKQKFTWEDIESCTVVTFDRAGTPALAELKKELHQRNVDLKKFRSLGGETIWECSQKKYMVLVPLCWNDIIFDMTIKPCSWDFCIPYGFFYKPSPSEPLQEFLDFIKETYFGDDPLRPVPVFS